MCQSDVDQMPLIYSFLWKNCPKPKEYTVHGSVVSVAQSCVTLCVPWTVAHQAPLSMGFCWQEYWSGLPCPPPRYLPDPVIEPGFPALQADSLPSEPPGKQWKLIW